MQHQAATARHHAHTDTDEVSRGETDNDIILRKLVEDEVVRVRRCVIASHPQLQPHSTLKLVKQGDNSPVFLHESKSGARSQECAKHLKGAVEVVLLLVRAEGAQPVAQHMHARVPCSQSRKSHGVNSRAGGGNKNSERRAAAYGAVKSLEAAFKGLSFFLLE